MAATGDVGVDLSSQPSLASVDTCALYLNLGRRKSREAFIEGLLGGILLVYMYVLYRGCHGRTSPNIHPALAADSGMTGADKYIRWH